MENRKEKESGGPQRSKRLTAVRTGKKPEQRSAVQKLDQEFKLYIAAHNMPVRQELNEITFAGSLKDRLLMAMVIRQGVPYSFFEKIKTLSPFTLAEWAEILNISTRSFQRYREDNQLFKSLQSEKIIELGELMLLGYEVFGDGRKFLQWLQMPSFALGQRRPADLLVDSYGLELVSDELHRIEHGVFS